MSYSPDQMIKYGLEKFPELYDFLKVNYNVSKVHAGDTFQISVESKLCRKIDDYMFHSYDLWEYSADKPSIFFEDEMRSAEENILKLNRSQKPQFEEFENFVNVTLRQVQEKIFNKHRSSCFRLLKIIYDYPQQISTSVAAMCVNQMFGRKLKPSMVKYNNTKKIKAILQDIRERFSRSG